MKTLDSHHSEISSVIYCSENQQILSSSWDQTIASHQDSLSAKNSIDHLSTEHSKDITCMTISYSLKLSASGSLDRTGM